MITASFGAELWHVICSMAKAFASVPFTGSLLVSALMTGLIVLYSKRRKRDAELTWGQAMGASFYVTFLMFWFFGVVPDQWMKYAEGTMAMRSDALLAGPKSTGWFEWLPITITKATVADLVTVHLYVIGLALTMFMWALWQNRGQKTTDEVATSTYGRPLVKA